MVFFDDYKYQVIGSSGAEPRKWASYHKMIIRSIQDVDDFFATDDNHKAMSPDAFIVKNIVDSLCKGHMDNLGIPFQGFSMANEEDMTLIEDWVEKGINRLTDLYEQLGLEVLEFDYIKLVKEHLQKKEILELEFDEDGE